MPVCPRCRVAYIEGESHACEPTASASTVAIGTLAGLVTGAICGALGLTVLFGIVSGSNLSGLVGILFGAPLGGIAGAIIGARKS